MSKLLSHEMSVDQLRKKIEEARRGRPDQAEIEEAEALLHVKMLEQTNQRLDEVSVTLEMYGAKLNRLTQSLRANVNTSEDLAKAQRRYSRTMLVLTAVMIFTVVSVLGTQQFSSTDTVQVAENAAPQIASNPAPAAPTESVTIATIAAEQAESNETTVAWKEAFSTLGAGLSERLSAFSQQVNAFSLGVVQSVADFIKPEPKVATPVVAEQIQLVFEEPTAPEVVAAQSDAVAPVASEEVASVESVKLSSEAQPIADAVKKVSSTVASLQEQFSFGIKPTSELPTTNSTATKPVSMVTAEEAAAAFDAAFQATQTEAVVQANQAFESIEEALSQATTVTGTEANNISWDIPAEMKEKATQDKQEKIQPQAKEVLPPLMVLSADGPYVPARTSVNITE